MAVRGKLNERRRRLIAMAFQKLDKNGDGTATFDELCDVYDTSSHPEVKSGKITHAQCLKEFMRQWDTREQDGIVTLGEFEDYYKVCPSCFLRLSHFPTPHNTPSHPHTTSATFSTTALLPERVCIH